MDTDRHMSPLFHGGDTSSNLVGDANLFKGLGSRLGDLCRLVRKLYGKAVPGLGRIGVDEDAKAGPSDHCRKLAPTYPDKLAHLSPLGDGGSGPATVFKGVLLADRGAASRGATMPAATSTPPHRRTPA